MAYKNAQKTARFPTQKMPSAFFVRDLGNRQQATGNRQHYTHSVKIMSTNH